MKKCPICHKMNEDDSTVCSVCGYVLDSSKPKENNESNGEFAISDPKEERRCLFCDSLIEKDSSECPVCGLEYGKREPDNCIVEEMEEKTKEDRETRVYLMDYPNKWLLAVSVVVPIIGFFLYGAWAMVACIFVTGIIQVLCGSFFDGSTSHASPVTIKVSEMKQYVWKEERKRTFIMLICILIGILDGYPFLATSERFMYLLGRTPYEGGVVVSLLVVLLWAFWIYIINRIPIPSINNNMKLLKEYGMTVEDKKKVEELRQKEMELRKIEKYGEGYISLGYDIFVNDKMKKIYIGTKTYNFKDILDFTVKDNAVTIHSASTSTAKTNTGSMIGRAVVGKVLLGNTGAVIGGATASKTIEHSESTSIVSHDYTVIITVDNITSPTETIRLRKDETALNKIAATLTIILKGN